MQAIGGTENNRQMADLSKREWENYEDPAHSKVYKNIATVMHKGITPGEVAGFYSEWANGDEYEKELPPELFNAPIVTAAAAAEGIPESERGNMKVFDVAAGTGLCGLQLKRLGFKHIDALDPAEGMLQKAKEKDIYERYICDYITDKPLDIEPDTYDALTISAGLGEGHIPCGALYEMIRVVKPGGTISIVTREEHLHTVEQYIDKLEPLMQKLENEGKWKQLKREIFKGFFLDKDGILWKFQVC